jgi:ABC-2 type transport system permease protein
MKERYRPWLQKANSVQSWLPPGLTAVAFEDFENHDSVPGLSALGLVGMYVLLVGGVLGLRLRAEYRGENLGTAPKRIRAVPRQSLASAGGAVAPLISASASSANPGLTSFVSGPIGAIIEKEARALLRTLPLLYAIGAPLLLVIVFSTMFVRNGGTQGHVFPLALPICMVYAQLGFTSIFYNNLGAEGAGIQLYFLSPTPIRTVLFAKNLFHATLFLITAVVAALLASLRVGVPDPAILAATGAWVLFALPCNMAAGNIVSIKMAYRVNPGRIGRAAGSQGNSFFSLFVQLAFFAVGAAVFALCWSLHNMWLAPPIFLVLAAAAVFVWLRVLDNMDALANRSKVELMETVMKTA